MKKLRFTTNPNEGKSIRIEKIGIKIELSLVQIEFLDLITSRSYISLNKKMKLGSKSFEIRDLSLYAQRSAVINKEATACPRCGAIISTGWRYCPYCSYNL
jgi:hypothetical protein